MVEAHALDEAPPREARPCGRQEGIKGEHMYTLIDIAVSLAPGLVVLYVMKKYGYFG